MSSRRGDPLVQQKAILPLKMQKIKFVRVGGTVGEGPGSGHVWSNLLFDIANDYIQFPLGSTISVLNKVVFRFCLV
jgi:hypothetical protein